MTCTRCVCFVDLVQPDLTLRISEQIPTSEVDLVSFISQTPSQGRFAPRMQYADCLCGFAGGYAYKRVDTNRLYTNRWPNLQNPAHR